MKGNFLYNLVYMCLLWELGLWAHLTVRFLPCNYLAYAIRMNVIWHDGIPFVCQWVCISSEIIVGSDNFIQHNNAISLDFESNYSIRKVNVVMF